MCGLSGLVARDGGKQIGFVLSFFVLFGTSDFDIVNVFQTIMGRLRGSRGTERRKLMKDKAEKAR
jgi:hypothetical protein